MIDMIIYGSLLILFIVLIRVVTLNKLPKNIFILLWFTAIFRLLVPFNMPMIINLYPVFDVISDIPEVKINEDIPASEITIPIVNDTFDVDMRSNVSNQNLSVPNTASQQTHSILIENLIPIIWIIGIAVTFAAFMIPHIKYLKRYKSALPIDDKFINDWHMEHSLTLRREYRILQSDEIFSPFTYGIFKPVIILPCDTVLSDNDVIDYILTHEYVHITRFDVLKKWLGLASLCVHWFNPLVWLMYSMLNNDIEIACDEKVIKSKGIDNKAIYAYVLVDMISAPPTYNMLVSNFNKNIIKKRIRLIMKTTKTTFRQIVLCLLIISFALLINITSIAKVNENEEESPIALMASAIVESEENIDPYAHVRFGETKDILLLDVEWYTYDSYYEEEYLPFIQEYVDNPEYDDKQMQDYIDYCIKEMESTLAGIESNRAMVAKKINGKSCEELGYPIKLTISVSKDIINPDYMEKHFDEDGYYMFFINPLSSFLCTNGVTLDYARDRITLINPLIDNTVWCVSSNLFSAPKHFIIIDNKVILDEDNKFYYGQAVTDGYISQEEYDLFTSSPLDYYVDLFF